MTASFLAALAKAQIPLALALTAFVALNAHYGFVPWLPAEAVIALATALGVPRASELAERLRKALEEAVPE